MVAVTRKTVGMPPFFEELAHVVDAHDPLLADVAPAAVAALDAVGVTDGVSHVEIRIVDGRRRLIEVNARIAGDMIGHLVHLATAVDLARAAADIACGTLPDLTPTRSEAVAIRLIYPAYSGTLTERHLDSEFTDSADWLERVTFHRDAGDQLVLPPDGDMFSARIGYLITTGPSAKVARGALHRGVSAPVRPGHPRLDHLPDFRDRLHSATLTLLDIVADCLNDDVPLTEILDGARDHAEHMLGVPSTYGVLVEAEAAAQIVQAAGLDAGSPFGPAIAQGLAGIAQLPFQQQQQLVPAARRYAITAPSRSATGLPASPPRPASGRTR
ncbi:hypothetical protein [Streptomyces monticola]|uniref:hypothetical protein n=1 Tax=Streptomyces monticola TaxID=2666263 RepID=UPI003AA980F9